MPMSCVLADQVHMDVFDAGSHGSTFGGNPLACAVSIAALDVLEQECMLHLVEKSKVLEQELNALARACNDVQSIRGMGLFYAIQFRSGYDIDALRERLLWNGLITCSARHNSLRISPPLTISPSMIRRAIRALMCTI